MTARPNGGATIDAQIRDAAPSVLGTLVRRTLAGQHPRGVTQPVHLREGTTTARPR